MSMAPVSISIIVPVYNTEKYLAACLDSILAQDIPYLDVIAVTNCRQNSGATSRTMSASHTGSSYAPPRRLHEDATARLIYR